MAAKNLGPRADMIIDAVMPDGQLIDMPQDLVDKLALRTPRYESPSSIREYLSCPLKWYIGRYAEIEGDVDPPGYAGVIGSFVHRVLEVFFSEPKEKRTHELLERIFRSAMDAIKQGNSEAGIIDPGLQVEFDYVKETMPKSQEEGGWGFDNMTEDKVVGAFFKRTRESIDNAKLFYPHPEEEEVISTEAWARVKIGSVIIRMKIDKISESPFGIEVIDYKTGRAPDEGNSDEDMECLRDANGEPILDDSGNKILLLSEAYIAMGIYALAVSMGTVDGMEAVTPRSVQMHYLKEGLKYTARVRPGHLDLVALALDRIIGDMLAVNETGKIMANPYSEEDKETGKLEPAGPCSYCAIKSICPVRGGREGDWTDVRKELDF